MDALTVFGLVTVIAMLVFYALEERNAAWTFWFAVTCLASSAYGFLQGAWPIGFVELAWTAVALRRWHGATRPTPRRADAIPIACDMTAFSPEERAHYHSLRDRVMAAVTASAETTSGFVLTVSDVIAGRDVAEWMTLERRCCPFLDLALRLDHLGPTRIELSGGAGAKELLRTEFPVQLGTARTD